MLLQLQGMDYKMISPVAKLAVFCFWKNVKLIVLFAMQLSDVFIQLMSDFLFKLPLLARHLSKYYLKNKNGENFVEKFEDVDFSYVLLPTFQY